MEELTLDEKLKELLKDFPISNNYAYLFIRIDKKTKEKDNGCILQSSNFENSLQMIKQYLESSPQGKMAVLNAVLEYYNLPVKIQIFYVSLNELVTIKPISKEEIIKIIEKI